MTHRRAALTDESRERPGFRRQIETPKSVAAIVAKSTICADLCGMRVDRERLLNQSTAYGAIRNNSSLDQQVAAAAAARPHPFLIQSQDVGVRRERAALTDLAQYVYERRELAGK